MKKRNFLTLGVLAVIIFAACQKSDNGPELSPKERMLTGRIWQLHSLTVPKSDDPTKDSSISKPCSDSALMAFDIYKAYQLANPSKACDSTIVPYDKGRWAFSSTSDSIVLEGKRKFVWKIKELSDTMIVATFQDSIAPTQNWIKTITLK